MGGVSVSIGNFDGVHLGHRALVARARQLAGTGGRVVVLVFDPHPASVLRPGREPARLTTFAQREELLRLAGADVVERLVPDPRLLAMTPEEFIGSLCTRLRPSSFVEGADFRFGRGREGDVGVLRVLGERFGYSVSCVEPVTGVLMDQLVAPISSSMVRWLLSHGRVGDAAALLGRAYVLEGVVTRGDQLGRTIGFPTANIACEQMLPADGVYAARAVLPDGTVACAGLGIGVRPTVAGTARRAEAHILDDGSGRVRSALGALPEYGWRLRLDVVGWLRDEVKFPGLDALRAQIARDMERARQFVGIA